MMNNDKHQIHWKKVELGDVIDVFDSKRIPLSSIERKKRQGIFPYYGASGAIDYIDDYIFDGKYLLVAEDGENLNSRKLPIAFWATAKFWVNNHAHIILGKEGVADTEFIKNWLLISNISGYITGAAQPKLSQANLKKIELFLPPFEVQKKVGAIIACFDDLIENNTKRIKLLEQTAQLIYEEWFVNFRFPGHEMVGSDAMFGEMPESWSLAPFSKVVDVNPQITFPKNREHRFVTMGDLSVGAFVQIPDGKNTKAGKKFGHRDTLFARITPCLENGKGGYMLLDDENEILFGSTEFIVLREKTLPSALVYLISRDERFRKHAQKSMVGASGRQRVQEKCFDSYEVPVAPKPLLDKFEAICKPIFREIYYLSHQNLALSRIRDFLLPKLMSDEMALFNQ